LLAKLGRSKHRGNGNLVIGSGVVEFLEGIEVAFHAAAFHRGSRCRDRRGWPIVELQYLNCAALPPRSRRSQLSSTFRCT